MGRVQEELFIKITSDFASAGIKAAQTGFSKLTSVFTGFTTFLRDGLLIFNQGIELLSTLGRTAMEVATTIFDHTIKAFADYEEALIGVAKVTGASAEEMVESIASAAYERDQNNKALSE